MVMHLIYGLVGGFLGGVAFGPVNLCVIEITFNKSIKSAMRFIVAACSVEILQAGTAVLFGKLISSKIEEFPQLKLLVIAFFLILGTYFLLKKDQPKVDYKSDSNASHFFKGFLVAILNPSAIPYWIFILAYLKSSNHTLDIKSWLMLLFLVGVYVGKFIILGLYGYLSEYIKKHLTFLNAYLSKSIGVFLIVLGIIQAIKYF